MRLFKRGSIWFTWFYEHGKRVQRSTRCHDKKAAEIVARQFERDAADPANAAAQKATLSDALQLLLRRKSEDAIAGRRSQQTVEFLRKTGGTLSRCCVARPQDRLVAPRLARRVWAEPFRRPVPGASPYAGTAERRNSLARFGGFSPALWR